MKKIYSLFKSCLIVSVVCVSFSPSKSFAQSLCGSVAESFNSTGGGTAGFSGSFGFASTGSGASFNGYLQKTGVTSSDIITITTPTYQLPANASGFGLGFTLSGAATIGEAKVSLSYVSSNNGQIVLKQFPDPAISYTGTGSNHQAIICVGNGTTTYSDFTAGGKYRFAITFTVIQGNNGTGDVIFDDFRTTGTLAQSPLPVAFINFSANKSSNGVQVDWKVAGEENVNHYELERSLDGQHYASIATFSVTKKDVYSYFDASVNSTAYYRIKNVDNDGKFKYSNIARIANGTSSIVTAAFPQPVISQLTLQHPIIRNGALITLSTVDGRTVSNIKPATGSMQTYIDMSKLQNGLYLVRFSNGDGSVETLKVVKQ